MGNSQNSSTAHVIVDAYRDIQLNCCQDLLWSIDECHEENFDEKSSSKKGGQISTHKINKLNVK